jgi:UDP-N-acetyl-2-amino-2-deoxyglucuronate dehydrogenase
MINVAILGAGSISSSHIEAYLAFPERCRIIAVGDIDHERARAQVEHYGLDAAVLDAPAAVLDTAATLVSVCTPPGTHAGIASDLLRNGRNVLIEKPMAASIQECDQVLRAAEAGRALLSVVAQNRFRTPMMRLKKVLDAGIAGPLRHVQVDSYWWRGRSYYDLWWRGTWQSEGGGCTLNHAVHHIDALQWMAGMPIEVQAMMANVAHDNAEIEDISVALLRFNGGAIGQLTSSVVHHGEEQQMVFQAERARISFPWRTYASTARPNGFPDENTALKAELDAYYDSLPTVTFEGHTGQVDDVLGALEQERPVLIDGWEGRKTIEISTAIYESAITGARLSLPLKPDDPFTTREGLLDRAPHFHEKTTSVQGFADNQITTMGRQPVPPSD